MNDNMNGQKDTIDGLYDNMEPNEGWGCMITWKRMKDRHRRRAERHNRWAV